jgi:hypothetical protein
MALASDDMSVEFADIRGSAPCKDGNLAASGRPPAR